MKDKEARMKLEWAETNYRELKDKYWDLSQQLEEIRKHLQLERVEVSKHFLLRKLQPPPA